MLGLAKNQDLEILKTNTDSELHMLSERIEATRQLIHFKVDNMPSNAQYAERLAEVEVKLAKLYNILLEETPTGRTKLSKFGKTFGGKAKSQIT